MTHIIEVMGVMSRKGIGEAVKLEEDVKRPITLSLRKGMSSRLHVQGKDIEKLMNRGIQNSSLVYTLREKDTDTSGLLTIVKVLSNKLV